MQALANGGGGTASGNRDLCLMPLKEMFKSGLIPFNEIKMPYQKMVIDLPDMFRSYYVRVKTGYQLPGQPRVESGYTGAIRFFRTF